MNSKVLVIISTGEKEKAFTGTMYAANAQKNKWIDERIDDRILENLPIA